MCACMVEHSKELRRKHILLNKITKIGIGLASNLKSIILGIGLASTLKSIILAGFP